jgi:glycosyltransferase involved in cell wall biosynthesis
MKKLAIITTHPIQYYAPVFKLLHARRKVSIKVFYTWGEGAVNKHDPGFNKKIDWDIPVLNGYPYEWVKNNSNEPGSHHFKGAINPELISRIIDWDADAILIYGWAYYSHIKVMRYFKGKIPVLFRGDSTLLDEKKGIKSVFKTLFLKWVYQHVDHAFYVGSNNKAYFIRYGLQEKQLTFAPHAIDNGRFAEDKKLKAELFKKELGIKENELLVMFAGKLEEKKNPKQLLDAFLSLESTGVHLIFIGNGKLELPLKHQAEKELNVHFVDFKNQSLMPEILHACDLFCLPSVGPGETWGLSVNEAMACGKAILASDKVGAAADLVKQGKNGLIFKAGSLNDLIEKLSKLVNSDKDGLENMGRYSEDLIKEWSFENQVKAIELFMNNV